MSKSKTELKGYFKNGSRPNETQFADLIDAFALEDEFRHQLDASRRDLDALKWEAEDLRNQVAALRQELNALKEFAVFQEEFRRHVEEFKRHVEESKPFVVDPNVSTLDAPSVAATPPEAKAQAESTPAAEHSAFVREADGTLTYRR